MAQASPFRRSVGHATETGSREYPAPISLPGGRMSKSCEAPRYQANGILPCSMCPWRVDQDAAAVQRVMPPLKAENLLRMVGTEDGFREIMQCHGTRDA